jgi:MFS family permease
MAEPWFEPNSFGTLFGIIGGASGAILCGVVGVMVGFFAPRGRAHGIVMTLLAMIIVAGLVMVAFGIYARTQGQPYGIWWPPLLLGILLAGVMGALMPLVRLRYREAQQQPEPAITPAR